MSRGARELRRATAAAIVAVALLVPGCGSEPSERVETAQTADRSSPTAAPTATPTEEAPAATADPSETASEDEGERRDREVERQLEAMERAAAAGDRAQVARAQRQLDRLAREDPEPPGESAAADPFGRMLDEFRFKQAPLYVRQVTSSDSHRIYVSVDRDTFCLMSPSARRAAARQVYGPADDRLRQGDVTDFEFIVVPSAETAPTYDDALAVGKDGRLRLTRRGRDC